MNGYVRARLVIALVLGGMLLGLSVFGARSPVSAETPVPLGRHCPYVSPIVPGDWCGCTWGAVFYQGRPVSGAQVTIDFGEQTMSSETQSDLGECYSFYGLNGQELDLSRLDVFTVTATFEGHSVSRVVRALPDELGEQQVNLLLPADGPPRWTRYAESDTVRAIAWHDGALWSGSGSGATRHQQPFGCATLYDDAHFSSADVRAVASSDASLWVGTPSGLSEHDGASWIAHDPGLASSNIQAIAAHPSTGEVYVGANDFDDGGVSRYDGSWHLVPDFNGSRPNTVQALLVDSAGRLWVGTDSGVSRCEDEVCVTYTTDDGLGSNNVVALAAAPNGDVWAATWSYVSPQGTRGGVSLYDADQEAWVWYTPDDGLAGWDVSAVVVDELGRAWFGVWGGGVSLFDQSVIPATWTTFTTTHGLPSPNVRSLALDQEGVVWAGTDAGLYRLADSALAVLAGASIEQVSPAQATQGLDVISFSGSAAGESEALGYQWRSSLDGPLSAAPSFELEAAALSVGAHSITFSTQGGDGRWSGPDEVLLVVEQGWQVYLPLLVRSD